MFNFQKVIWLCSDTMRTKVQNNPNLHKSIPFVLI